MFHRPVLNNRVDFISNCCLTLRNHYILVNNYLIDTLLTSLSQIGTPMAHRNYIVWCIEHTSCAHAHPSTLPPASFKTYINHITISHSFCVPPFM
jgi:hypothetical protein